ncbi:MAG: lamin tail domain-containing protein [Crocinitomicaceae bacterium]|nr:lamin tail domain-containing protein [Crocinitomicaceae bacterium]
MKTTQYSLRLILVLFVLNLSYFSKGQLIISEYLEGASFDKCIELYNTTANTINLTGYNIKLYANGNTSATSTINLTGSIESCGTFVLCHSSASQIGSADQTNGSLSFNGDDAVGLYNGTTLLDIFGNIGNDPGSQWTGVGSGTQNGGFIRNASYCTGVTTDPTGTGPASFTTFTALNWTPVGQTGTTLGTHASNCGACSTNTISTGVISGASFNVDCTISTTDAGTIAFTSTGVYAGGNIYSAEISDATGSFSSPMTIGTLVSTANSGIINFTIPATMTTGVGYLIRIVSNSPATTGSSSSSFTIVQNGICGPTLPSSEGLIINEWSNGPSGNKEYYEFVVAGQCGATVDIRGYILDDNNGTFTTPASYSGTSSGIAPGHFRFSNSTQWGAIPVGSLIVIYNNNDINPDLPAPDPTDANNDSLYVVPHDNPLFERCLSYPASSSPDSVYIPCTYATSPLTGWGALSLRNSGDAIQVRHPDGSYYHGVSYGGSEMSGGPNNLKQFTGSGSNTVGWFNSGDFFDIGNWSSGATAGNQTPGLPNNAANYAWLLAMRDPTSTTCPIVVLPIEIVSFHGTNKDGINHLSWRTESERNSLNFEIQRSNDGNIWQTIATAVAAGESQQDIDYRQYDFHFPAEVNYYRLKQNDGDGVSSIHPKIIVLDNRIGNEPILVRVVNILGQDIEKSVKGIQIHIYSDGTSKKVLKH